MNHVKKSFPITGMTCASCAVSVESMLQHQTGIDQASVNYANGEVLLTFDAEQVKLSALKAAVQSIGYDMLIESPEDAQRLKEEIQNKEYKSLVHKTIGALFFAVPVSIIGMFFMDMPFGNYIMMALTLPVLIFFGNSFFINAYKQAKHGHANMDTLVALSTGIAFIFSSFNTIYPNFWHSRGQHPHVYFEASAVVIAFILLGKVLEEKAKSNTSSAVKKLIGLQPQTVTRVLENTEEVIPIDYVNVGDRLLVKPGEHIAVDGIVSSGHSYVDESMINGEPVPVEKKEGDIIFAGTINQKSSFQFIAQKVGQETLLAHIIKRVQEAQGSKAPVQKLVDKIAGIFVPIVISIAFLTFITWIIFGGPNALTQALLSMVTVLVIACPCALGLATPTAIMVGIGKGASQGILIKDAESLELAHKMNVLILDKTGTITSGKPEVTDLIWFDVNNNQEHLASILYAIERQSEHPLAEAVCTYLKKNNALSTIETSSFESHTGKGVSALVNESTYHVGTPLLLKEKGLIFSNEITQQATHFLSEAKTVVWFADARHVVAMIAIADKVKASSAEAIKQLKALNIDVYMLTGDNASTAKAVAAQVGIEHFKAETLPSDKADFIKQLQEQGNIVGMVGDGINDSQALAQANISIAMGQGSDIAIDVAKMTIISSDLLLLPKAIKLSQQTVNTIKQNLFWAFIYNLIGIPIAAGVLYPSFGFQLNPMIAGAAMALSSVCVVSNSLLLKLKK